LKVDEEYMSLLPPLSQPEFEALKRSIKEDGLHYPIIANKRGVVLDGHNRLKVCRELGIKPRFEVRDFSNDRLREKKFVIVSNLRRRHLNDFQKIELSQPLLSIQRTLAKQRQVHSEKSFGRGLLPNGRELPNGEAVEKVAREIGVSPRTYYRALSIIQKQPEAIKRKLREGKIEINTAYANLQSEKKRKQLIALSRKPLPNPVKILCGDYRHIWSEHIEDGTADIVLTDPQYGMKGNKKSGFGTLDDLRQMWSDLGDFSSKVLKEGGYLFAYTGQEHSYVAETCLRQHLHYYWKITVSFGSNQTQLFHKKIRNRCKQILVFVKGKGRDHEWFFDLLQGGGKGDKQAHEWAQPKSEAAYLISKFTKPNDLVVDPMSGTGSVLKAAVNLRRKAIGFELDPESFKVARGTLASCTKLSFSKIALPREECGKLARTPRAPFPP
jgi:ParB-like chromosome segregation protein Spo0J